MYRLAKGDLFTPYCCCWDVSDVRCADVAVVNVAVSGRRFGYWFRWIKLNMFDSRAAPANMLHIYLLACVVCDLEVRVTVPHTAANTVRRLHTAGVISPVHPLCCRDIALFGL